MGEMLAEYLAAAHDAPDLPDAEGRAWTAISVSSGNSGGAVVVCVLRFSGPALRPRGASARRAASGPARSEGTQRDPDALALRILPPHHAARAGPVHPALRGGLLLEPSPLERTGTEARRNLGQ